MTTDAGRALDGEPDDHWVLGLGRNVSVLARDLGRSIVVERQQVDLVRNHGLWGWHVEGEEETPRSPKKKLPSLNPKLGFELGTLVADDVGS